jgi:hypothetical protein
VSYGRESPPGRRLPLCHGKSLSTRLLHSTSGIFHFEASSEGSLAFTRPAFPLACDSRMERVPLGVNFELRTPPLPATHVEAGTGQRTLTRDYTLFIDPPSGVSTHLVQPRVARLIENGSVPLGGCCW